MEDKHQQTSPEQSSLSRDQLKELGLHLRKLEQTNLQLHTKYSARKQELALLKQESQLN